MRREESRRPTHTDVDPLLSVSQYIAPSTRSESSYSNFEYVRTGTLVSSVSRTLGRENMGQGPEANIALLYSSVVVKCKLKHTQGKEGGWAARAM